MNRLPAVLLTAGIPVLLLAQTVPRAPVVRLPPSAPALTPTPVAAQDPTGNYVGTASVQLSGSPGVFQQRWRIPVQARSCQDCDSGQFFFHSTSYDGTFYSSGDAERGGVYGFLNPSGTVVDLELFATNCQYLNPSNFRAPVSGSNGYVGQAFGGHFGESPGGAVTIRNGILSGRISGRDCFGQLLTADVSLQRDGTSVLSCSNLSGNYSGSFANSCGGSGSSSITVVGYGCAFSALIPAFGVVVDGTLTSATSSTVKIKFLSPCSGSATGTASISGNVISGAFGGTSNGGFGCCPPGPVSGTFVLTR